MVTILILNAGQNRIDCVLLRILHATDSGCITAQN